MPPENTSSTRPGARRGITICPELLVTVLTVVFLVGVFSICLSVIFTGCWASAPQAVMTVADAVPTPSEQLGAAIRSRVAAVVKTQVSKRPNVAGWGNELAKVCYRFADTRLPAPEALRGYFSLAGIFVPAGYQADFAALSERVLTLYEADYPVLLASQRAGGPYLTLIGQGIQDGIAAAGVHEAP